MEKILKEDYKEWRTLLLIYHHLLSVIALMAAKLDDPVQSEQLFKTLLE